MSAWSRVSKAAGGVSLIARAADGRRSGARRRARPLGHALAALAAAAVVPVQAAASDPDITGVWRMARPGEGAGPEQMNPPIPPPPLTPEFAAAYAASQKAYRDAEAEGRPLARDRELCIPDGFPRMMTTDSPLEILQTPGRITLITEFLAQIRRIDLARASHPSTDELVPSFFGDSVGRWEGGVLVVDTVGLKDRVLLFNDVPHSEAVRIVERIRLTDPNTLRDDVTVTDPKALTAPWTVTRIFVRRPDLAVAEFVCQEGNRNYRDADGRLATRMPE